MFEALIALIAIDRQDILASVFMKIGNIYVFVVLLHQW